jgi:hypothetical protein
VLQVILYLFEFESFSTFSIKENGYEWSKISWRVA